MSLMKAAILILLALPILAACTNTREGFSQDARRMGEKTQAIGQILVEP